ncbi:hypothetical protein GCM10010140_50730 [Streptosporangium pseudovulgare]|uniref:Bacterial bifunctional deaminase-reductase C-terminal domain-containing protein n=1 Tax=Streptosporangium pseudovulgare TaxID=35765 RepID=A0ABQ2R9D6_9ACTN|nr:hypothetical protein GCM10010140_50730 [Streptosporangium pseudovulgare]
MSVSLDGCVSDLDGRFGRGAPEEEPHEFIDEGARSTGTYRYGRPTHETTAYRETAHTVPDRPPFWPRRRCGPGRSTGAGSSPDRRSPAAATRPSRTGARRPGAAGRAVVRRRRGPPSARRPAHRVVRRAKPPARLRGRRRRRTEDGAKGAKGAPPA